MESPAKVPNLFDGELFGYNKKQVDSYVGNLTQAYKEVSGALTGLGREKEKAETKAYKQAPSEKVPDLKKTIEDFYAEALGSSRVTAY